MPPTSPHDDDDDDDRGDESPDGTPEEWPFGDNPEENSETIRSEHDSSADDSESPQGLSDVVDAPDGPDAAGDRPESKLDDEMSVSEAEELSPDRQDPEDDPIQATTFQPDTEPTVPAETNYLTAPLESLTISIAKKLRDDTTITDGMESTFESAGISKPTDLFVAQTIVFGLLAGLVALIAALGVTAGVVLFKGQDLLFGATTNLALTAVAILAIPAFAASLTILVRIARLELEASSRSREIDALLPEAITYMYTLASGNMNHLDIIRSVATSEDSYGEVSREFQAIVREAEYIGNDYQKAIVKQAHLTPSEDLSRFLTDFLTVLRSGGDVDVYLKTEAEAATKTSRETTESELELLELLAEIYLAVSLFPLIIVIILAIVSTIRDLSILPMVAIIYGLIPILSFVFITAISTVRSDELGTGQLTDTSPGGNMTQTFDPNPTAEADGAGSAQRTLSSAFGTDLSSRSAGEEARKPKTSLHPASTGLTATSTVDIYRKDHPMFDRIESQQIRKQIAAVFTSPYTYFRENPLYTLFITVPAVILIMAVSFVAGFALAPTPDNFVAEPNRTTLFWVYLPIIGTLSPLAVFERQKHKTVFSLFESFPEVLRNIASANDTGLTLMESIKSTISERNTLMDQELTLVYQKTSVGIPLERALVDMNNVYEYPPIARVIRLISEAQRSSEELSKVLGATITTTENRLEIMKQQRRQTQIQAGIICFSTLIMLGMVLMLDRFFIDLLISGTAGEIATSAEAGTNPSAAAQGETEEVSLSSGIDADIATVIFFHGATMHAIFSGFIAGYLKENRLVAGAKYAIPLMVIVGVVWVLV